MSLAVAGLAGAGVRRDRPDCAGVSYPGFWEHARALGGVGRRCLAGTEFEEVDPA